MHFKRTEVALKLVYHQKQCSNGHALTTGFHGSVPTTIAKPFSQAARLQAKPTRPRTGVRGPDRSPAWRFLNTPDCGLFEGCIGFNTVTARLWEALMIWLKAWGSPRRAMC